MKTSYRPFARKFRQFNHQAKTIKRLHTDGKFKLLSQQQQLKLVNKLKQLYTDLRGRLQPWRLKKTLAGLSFLLIGLGSMPQANAQVFAAPQVDPFGIEQTIGGYNFTTLADTDNDGDLDLFILAYDNAYNNSVLYQENQGTAAAPDFAAPITNPFGILPNNDITTIDFVDIDGDGDMDLFSGTYDNDQGHLRFYENTGDATSPSFAAPVLDPFGFSPTNTFSVPKFADIDSDGDMDLFISENYSALRFFENTGSSTAANFSSSIVSPFGISSENPYINFLDFADMDSDGDLDLVKGGEVDINTYIAGFSYQENIGTAAVPDFDTAIIDPFGLEEVEGVYFLYPEVADIDDDGDLDIFTGIYYSTLFFENLGLAPTSADAEVFFIPDIDNPFNQDDFEFMDQNGDTFDAVKIVSTVSVGMLQFNSIPVNVGQVIPIADINALTFTPLPGDEGLAYDSFVFQVADDQGAFSDDYTMTINVDSELSARNFILNASIEISPNPSDDLILLNLEAATILSQVQFNLMDNTGRILIQQEATMASNQIQEKFDISQLAAGSYFIQINADGKTLSKQFVKK